MKSLNSRLLFECLLFLALSAATVIEGFRIKDNLSALDYISPLRPDNYLQLLGGAMALATILYFVREGLLSGDAASRGLKGRIFSKNVIVASALFALFYIVLLEWLGFSLSTLLFYFIYLRIIGKYRTIRAALISIMVTVGYYGLFVKGLDTILPRGMIESLLGV